MAELLQQWIAAMRAERFEAAWALSEAAMQARDPATRDDPSLPYHLRWVWDGRPVDGQDVLVRCYHGLGDTIQFARFLPSLGRRARSVTVEVQPVLLTLLAGIEGVDRLMPFDPARPLPASPCDVEIMELSCALREGPDTAAPPYLHAPYVARRRAEIGLCHTTGEWDEARRILPELFASLCRDHRCATLVPAPTSLDVVNPAGCSLDVEATAALIASLDLVISVDTMVAHLAGAMGKPTWVLLKHEPDWRWCDPPRSSWYPATRTFRQPEQGDWGAVLAQVEQALAREIRLAEALVH